MAGKEFPLSIVLRTIDKSTAVFRKVAGEADKLSGRLGKIGKSATAAGKSLTAGLTLPIVGLGVAGVKSMMEFEQGMSNVSTLIDTNAESMDKMSAEVLEVAKRTPVALSELTSALFDLRSGGIEAGDAMNVLEKSAQLGSAGLGTTAEAANLVTGAINAFKLEGDEADRVYDTIFKTTKNGITTIAGLSQGFGAVAGSVASSGVKLDEYLAAVSALTTTTLPASVAHTQLGTAIGKLSKPTKQVKAVMKTLGVKDMKELIKNSGGLVGAFKKLDDALEGNEGKMRALVGSKEAYAAVSGLLGQQNDKFTGTLHNMRNEADEFTEAAKKQNETTQAQWQRTKNSLNAAAITMGQTLAPAFEKISKKVIALANWFSGLDSSTKEWIVQIAAVVAVIGPALLIFGKLASVLGIVTTAVRVLTLALLANPIGLIITAVAALIAIFWKVGQALAEVAASWELVKDFFGELWDDMTSAVRSAWEPIAGFFTELWDDITGIFERAWEFISDIVDKVKAAVDFVVESAGAVADFAGDVVDSVGDAASGAVEAVGDFFGFGGDGPQPIAGINQATAVAGQPGAGGKSETAVKVSFDNLPRGARVEQSGAPLDLLSTGFQMLGLDG